MDCLDNLKLFTLRGDVETLKDALNETKSLIEDAKEKLEDLQEALDRLNGIQAMLEYWPEGKWSDEKVRSVNSLKKFGFTQDQLDRIFERRDPILFTRYEVGDVLHVFIKDLPEGVHNVFWIVTDPEKGEADILIETDEESVIV